MPRPPLGYGKESHFTDRGHLLKGVVHVGANDGEEITWYLHVGRVPILAFEPLYEPYAEACDSFAVEIEEGKVKLVRAALAAFDGSLEISVPRRKRDKVEATKGTSGLPELYLSDEYEVGRVVRVPALRFETWANGTGWNPVLYNLLVIDVQGMELDVLRGMGSKLYRFDYLMIELSEKPLYIGEPPAHVVCEWLEERGYRRDSPILDHNDVMFLKENL